MYRHHPQWIRAQQLVREGKVGEVRTIHSFFSYYNIDPDNVRNKVDIGGGGLLDIGCYCISLSRFIFETEPERIFGVIEEDKKLKIDRLTSGILDFPNGFSTFTCATQLTPYQRVHIFGTKGRIEIEIPFNAPPDKPCKIWYHFENKTEEIVFDICNQFTTQGDLFSQAILNDTEVPTKLNDAVANMKVIEAIFNSATTGCWTIL